MNKTICLAIIGWALALQGGQAQSKPSAGVGITKLVIKERKPAFGGASFGTVGQYEMLTGVAYGELDPKDPINAGIVNLQYAPLNARGHVEYDVDITILKPLDMAKGNGRLVYDVINRGHEKGLSDLNLNHFDSVAPAQVTDPASGFWMKRGYTVAWSAWEGEDSAETSKAGLLKARFPIATRDGKPIVGRSREEFTSIGRGPSFTRTLTYPAASLDQSAATLTVRELEGDPRKPLPASSWSYIDNKHVKISTAAGFDPEALYEFIHPATEPVIEGIGFPAVRDFVFFLRDAEKDSTGQPNPVHPPTPFKAVLGMGVSQSGRFLKDMVYQNFHVDGSGRKVFDGILTVVSGSRKTNVNTEFSMPGRYTRQHEDHTYPGADFPFTYTTTTDPISGKTDGLQMKCAKAGTCPPTIQIDTDTEMWTARGSLIFTDPSGKDVAIPDNVRVFILTGVPHNNRDLGDQWTSEGIPERGICTQYRNPLEYRHYVRSLLVALDQWVTEGVAPPASHYPSLKAGTLVTVAEAGKLWPAIPGVPFSPVISKLQLMDYSQQPPKASGPEYPIYVARTNAEGSPIGGVVPPEITVPIATYSGRNYRAPGFAQGDLCNINGSYIPLAVTRAERLANKDPRLSLEERYKSQADFSAKRKAAAERMVKERLLLPEDAEYFYKVELPKRTPPAATP
jgi:hypothetical protein